MSYQTTIEKQGLSAIFDIKGNISAVSQRISHLGISMPTIANTASSSNGQHLCWIGEEHWIVMAPADHENQLLDSLAPNDSGLDCRIVLVSDFYSIFTVTGKQADDIIAIASPLDIRPTKFADNGATYSELFGIRALIVRRSDGYIIAVERSYGDMITAYFDKVMTGKR
jgi:heterotetrameric sarcosine oxidase gamma subunit